MWHEQFKSKHPEPCLVGYEVSGEMRTAFADWIAEHYGIHPGIVEFESIAPESAVFSLALGTADSTRCSSYVEFHLYPTGKVEPTLVIYNGGTELARMSLPGGELPPDKESFAVAVSYETMEIWKHRMLGWHPDYREMLDCLRSMADAEDIDFDCLTVAGFYPDGEQLPESGSQYQATMDGLQAALVHARAMLKGGQEYMQHTPLDHDHGDFMLVIFPGPAPLDSGEWLHTVGDDYCDWMAELGITNPDQKTDDDRWFGIMPLIDGKEIPV